MIGDPDKLQPHIGKGQGKNRLESQLELSLQSQPQLRGLASALFTTRYRALSEILPRYNNAVYKGLLTSNDSTDLVHPPFAQDARRLCRGGAPAHLTRCLAA